MEHALFVPGSGFGRGRTTLCVHVHVGLVALDGGRFSVSTTATLTAVLLVFLARVARGTSVSASRLGAGARVVPFLVTGVTLHIGVNFLREERRAALNDAHSS